MKVFLRFVKKGFLVLMFVGFYIIELVKANVRIAYDILSMHTRVRPGIAEIELDAKSDLEILTLVNLISMTPGSLCIDISEDKKYIYVHEMYFESTDALRKSIKNGLEKRILEISR